MSARTSAVETSRKLPGEGPGRVDAFDGDLPAPVVSRGRLLKLASLLLSARRLSRRVVRPAQALPATALERPDIAIELAFPDGEHAGASLSTGIHRMGSAPESRFVIHAPTMPMLAAEIHVSDRYIDLHPRTNTEISVNGRRIFGLISLRNGDRLRIAGIRVNVVKLSTGSITHGPDERGVESDDASSRMLAVVPKYALRGLTGTQTGRLYPLHGNLTMGRDPECQIVLENPDVSRRHAALRLTVQGIVVDDLASRNGVYINDHQVQRGVLRVGDELRLATSRFLMCSQRSSGYCVPANKPAAAMGRPASSARSYVDWKVFMLIAVVEAVLIAIAFVFR